MIKLQLGIRYELNLTGRVELGPIKKQVIYERLTDGRIAGLLGEDFANAIYNNVTKSPSENEGHDLQDTRGRLYEVRSVTKNGVKLIPSAQIGSGRKYDKTAHQAKIDSLYAFVFMDVRNSPILTFVGIEAEQLRWNKALSPKQFDALIADLPKRQVKG